MATELQLLYVQARINNGDRHHAALREVASRTGLDKDTIDRCLRRARRADERDARQERQEP